MRQENKLRTYIKYLLVTCAGVLAAYSCLYGFNGGWSIYATAVIILLLILFAAYLMLTVNVKPTIVRSPFRWFFITGLALIILAGLAGMPGVEFQISARKIIANSYNNSLAATGAGDIGWEWFGNTAHRLIYEICFAPFFR